jgi:hypothetical protein
MIPGNGPVSFNRPTEPSFKFRSASLIARSEETSIP